MSLLKVNDSAAGDTCVSAVLMDEAGEDDEPEHPARSKVAISPATFWLPVRADPVVATLRLPKAGPIPACPGAANVSGVFPGKSAARIVAQACPIAP